MRIVIPVCCVVFLLFDAPENGLPFTGCSTRPEPVTLLASGIHIEWDATTLNRISHAGTSGFYPRMLQLIDGSLFIVYASNGNVVGQKSFNGGRTWSLPRIIAAGENGVNRDTPELLQLQSGVLLLCYGSRPQGALRGTPEPDKHFDIRVKRSNDGGITWEAEKVLYKAGSSMKNGCWEPAAVQLPSGEVHLFFANEAPYTASDEQNISMLRSTDNGQTWSTVPQVISFRNGSRDGMPVPLWLRKTNELVVAIEDPGIGNFKPYIIRSAAGGKWPEVIDADNAQREYAVAERIADSVYAGAPYLRQLSSGETILSYQSTEGRKVNRDHNAVMVVVVGDAQARTFSNRSLPFDVSEGRHALWNSLCVLKGDTLVALTSTNMFSERSEVWMIKGYVKRQN